MQIEVTFALPPDMCAWSLVGKWVSYQLIEKDANRLGLISQCLKKEVGFRRFVSRVAALFSLESWG